MARCSWRKLDDLPAKVIIERLTVVRGFGRWTAEMFLMFRLHRSNVLPVGDLGIVNAIKKMYGLRKQPDAKRLLKIGDAWKPYRSVACWYLWQSLSLETSGVGLDPEQQISHRDGDERATLTV